MKACLPALTRGAVLTVLISLAGCAAFAPKIEPPRLAIVHVAMTSADIFNQQFLVRLNVANPNDRDLPVRGIEYQLFLEGDAFAEGSNAKPFTIPALADTEFDLTVRTNFVSGIGRLLSRLNGRTDVKYVLEGKVHTDLGFVKKVPFTESGTVSLAVVK